MKSSLDIFKTRTIFVRLMISSLNCTEHILKNGCAKYPRQSPMNTL